MIKTICILASLCLIILSVSDALSGERLYDFRDDSAWDPITAEWEIVDGEYVQTGSTDSELGMAVLKESEGVDTIDVESIEVMAYDLGSGAWQNIFIIFGFDEANPVSYLAGPFVGGAQEWRIETFNSVTRGGRSKQVGLGDVLSPEKWYHLRVVFEDDSVVLYGAEEGEKLEERVSYNFPQGKPSGRVGLGGSNCENKFDDFIVSGPDIKPLSVEPEDKLSITWGKIKMGGL